MMHRSFEQLDKADLARVYALARKRLDAMLADSITGKHYSADNLLMACLCQGAARHYMYGYRGVKDIDVVFFFANKPGHKFNPRWRGTCDFGSSKFCVDPDADPKKYAGRRIDVLGRDIPVLPGQNAEQAIVAYLQAGRTQTAHEWAKRPMVALTPCDKLGHIIW